MNMHRWIWRSLPMATALVAGSASLSWAQWIPRGNQNQEELFEWNGSVDREVQIVMRGNRVWTNNVGWTEAGHYNARAMTSLPRQDGQVFVQVVDGRGNVDVIEQPSAQNGYSTTIRIRDPRSGSDRYRVVAYYRGNGYSDNGVYGDDRSHGRRGDEMRRRHDNDGDDDDDRGRSRGNGGVYGGGVNGGGVNGGGVNGGYGNSMLHWTGNVDDELEIRMQNGRLEYRTIHGAQPTSIRVNDVGSQMPRSNATLSVVEHQGRGQVWVTQQPTAWNGYTTVIHVRDPQGGYGFYDFDLVWR
jgi:hypothetical protein